MINFSLGLSLGSLARAVVAVLPGTIFANDASVYANDAACKSQLQAFEVRLSNLRT